VDVRIRDESGAPLPTGTSGEIWIRGAALMRGYLSARKGSDSGKDGGGWFCTEDIGWSDSDGYLYVSERRQDVLRSSGIRVSCQHIERLLCDGGMAEDAAAIVVEVSHRETRLVVAVVPTSGGPSLENLTALLQGATSLPEKQITVLRLERLPRTSSGKPDRLTLRRLASANEPSTQGARS
jgi:fatty-acyl-CoA synthase